ncbi:MAG: outer membrane lipoprotein-sorting protein [Azospirillum sp.]|nr:outer membrane lipoprotein-sorting protein [Azospirillum sp.]
MDKLKNCRRAGAGRRKGWLPSAARRGRSRHGKVRLAVALAGAAAVVIGAVSAGPAAAQAAPSAQEIVARSDAVRNPERPFRLIDTLTEYRSGKPQNQLTLLVYSKRETTGGQYRTLVRWLQPPRDQDKLLLKTGNLMWFYDPASKASVRLSPQQRLLGQAANGDVVTVNLALDYRASLAGEETITDADRKSRPCWRLDLAANSDAVTYFRVEYWVDRESFVPVKGKFYSDSGRLLKIAYYRRLEDQLGRSRPTETLIIDGIDTELVTKMNFSDYQYRDIPDSWFSRDYLPRFKGE